MGYKPTILTVRGKLRRQSKIGFEVVTGISWLIDKGKYFISMGLFYFGYGEVIYTLNMTISIV